MKLKFLLATFFATFLQVALLAQNIISGTVKDVDSGKAVFDAEISFYNESNIKIFNSKTNDAGDFSINTNLKPGDRIEVLINHPGYKDTRINHIIENTIERNRLRVYLIPQMEKIKGIGDIPISIHIYEHKNRRKPINNVNVNFFDSSNRKISGGQTDEDGYFIFYPNATPGQQIEVRMDKEPRYKLKPFKYTIKVDNNRLEEVLKKEKKIKAEHYMLGASILFTGLATTFKIRSNKKYNQYLDVYNFSSAADWQDAKSKADSSNAIFQTTAIAGGLAISSYIVYKFFIKKKVDPDEEIEETYSTNYPRFHVEQNGTQVSLIYSF